MSEAFVFRTWPFQEADLIVSFFTRDQGKLRGVAKRARRPKSNFGSGLERLSQVKASYYQRETLELVRLEGCELVQSQFALSSHYAAGVALDSIAEVSDQLLPASEPNDRFYRLLGAVLAELRAEPETGVWRSLLYFQFWAVRLSGFLPELRLKPDSRIVAEEILRSPISALRGRNWTKDTASDLRRGLVREIEDHIERRLQTASMVEAL